ncbi:MAG: redoxin domain-containing protein [Saprospiraceae bacterium]|nr:redoxin domain-containing protein [Saprospiraceae bacterium]
MKIPTTTLLLCLALSFTQAQTTAPDFTVTTADGVQRQLYNDYLNQGKAVVLYLFFTTCPLCNQIAPLLEPFYQEWGGGDGPVEFLMLSILTTDDNLDVDRYIGLRNFTFPGAGSDGGAREAIEPYTNGSFGPYLGTPVFIVIAPDSTVQYDVRGSSYPETIDSLDAALRSITAKPALPFQIIGEVKTLLVYRWQTCAHLLEMWIPILLQQIPPASLILLPI